MAVTESLPVVDAVRRELEIDEQFHEGRTQVRAVLTLTTNITRSPAQLWPLLTRPAQLAGWFGPVSGDLREGGLFEAPQGASGRVLQVEAPHKIALTWDRHGRADPLLIRLDPEDDGTTELRLRHTTLIEREEFDRAGPGLGAIDWEIALLALAAATDGWRASCLRDVPVPTSGWLATQEGAQHVRAWSVRWAAQAVAAGVDEATARQGEKATTSILGG
ncbi:SRPBCC domain-containing protein [Brachybacterium sp. FME24]|uniref:SRPBCC domain-containing protein n=1 Tax=Brachybacterium sp. FME24 TaxID=2742605 RepID=UPI0018669B1E|nr:SRPBCC domain-containing protein [Brachybacterium sp. FME24]